MNEDSIEIIVDKTECDSIQVQDSNNASFSRQKKGFIRLIKDEYKYGHFLEIYSFLNSVKLELSYLITNRVASKSFKKNFIYFTTKSSETIRITFLNEADCSYFIKKFEECLSDVNLTNTDSTQINNQSIHKPNPIVTCQEASRENKILKSLDTDFSKELNGLFKPQNTRKVLGDKDDQLLLKHNKSIPYRPLSSLTKPHKPIESNENEPPSLPPISSQQSSNNISKKFYSTQVTLKHDKENMDEKENETRLYNLRLKRRISPVDENQNNNESISGINLPKKTCQRNLIGSKNSITPWNRNSSSNKLNIKGFSNLGNTCYMNAILQCLLNIDSFSSDLRSNKKFVDNLSKDCLYISLYNLLKYRETSNEQLQTQALKQIKNAISQEAIRFSGYQQHDAHEFLCQVLDQLKEDADKIKKQHDTTNTFAQHHQQKHELQMQFTNPVIENFEFQVTHSIQCTECFEVITKKEEFNNLCLEFPILKEQNSKISLQDALELFFQDENVNFNCEKCSNNLVKITHKFSKLPRILILYLKRYQFEDGINLVKNDCSIEIPSHIYLRKLCEENVDEPTAPVIRPKNEEDRATSPQVLSIIEPNNLSKPLNSGINDILPNIDDVFTTIDEEISSLIPHGYDEEEAMRLAIEASLVDAGVNPTPTKPVNIREPLRQISVKTRQDNDKAWSDIINDKVINTYLDRQVPSRTRESSKIDETITNENIEMVVGNEHRGSMIQSLSLEEINQVDQETNMNLKKSSRRETFNHLDKHSYRLIGVVSHLGQSSNSGHYISDVLNLKTNTWSIYDDLKVEKETEDDVITSRSSTGYIFFYMFNSSFE